MSTSDTSPETAPETKGQSSTFVLWLKLARISLLPSAISNIVMAYLISHPGSTFYLSLYLLCLVLASSCLYVAGMILNDYYDFETDRELRPNRPLPSGAISSTAARNAGFGLLGTGVAVAFLAGLNFSPEFYFDVRPMVVAVVLAIAIVLYNGKLKKTALACPLMGLCRGLNVFLGASLGVASYLPGGNKDIATFLGFNYAIWWIALAIFVLVTGVTWFARKEASQVSSSTLLAPAIVIVIGLLAYIVLPFLGLDVIQQNRQSYSLVVGMLAFLSLPIVRNVVIAVSSGSPRDVQRAVVSVLRSLIVLDAALCLLSPGNMLVAFCVLGLLIPALLLSRIIPAT